MNQRVKFMIDGIEMSHVSSGAACKWCDETLAIRTDEEMAYGLETGEIYLISGDLIVVCSECGEHNAIAYTSSYTGGGMPNLYIIKNVNIVEDGDPDPVYNPHLTVKDIIVQDNFNARVGLLCQLASSFVYTPQGNVALRSERDGTIEGKYIKIRTGLWRKDCFTSQYYIEGDETRLRNTVTRFADNVKHYGYDAAIRILEDRH